jgi:hypothetical protein
MQNKKKKPARGRGGAKPGNKNALKHGFYSKHFNITENKRIEGSDTFSIEGEIELIRVCIDRLAKELSFENITHTDEKGNESRDRHYLEQLDTLSIMTQSLSTMIRTHHLTRGKGGVVEKGILDAMEELRLEMGL